MASEDISDSEEVDPDLLVLFSEVCKTDILQLHF